MKKITKILLLIAILLSPIFVNAKEKVEITNIEEIEKKGEVIVLAEPTYEGLTINYNISFNNLNDSIKYKVTIKNNDTEEYKISNETIFSESGYISYSFSFEDNINIIKPSESKDMFITVAYTKEVPDNQLVSGAYVEQNKMDIIFVNDEGNIPNPNTNSTTVFIFIIVLMLLIGIILFKRNRKLSILLLVISLLLPVSVYALKEIKLTLNTRIEINNEREFCNYSFDEETNKTIKHYYKYKKGMTWKDWNNSSYFNQSADIGYFIPQNIIECEEEVESHYDFDNITQDDWNNYTDELDQCEKADSSGSDINEKIKDKSEGCYAWRTV